MKYTKKTDYTKEQIINALINVMEIKPFDRITINDIVNKIHINRSTFYRYFDDKYELLEDIENALLTEMHNKRKDLPNTFDVTEAFIVEGLSFYNDHMREFRVLLGPNGDLSLEERLKKEFYQRFDEQFEIDRENRIKLDIIKQAVLTLGMHMLKYWVFSSGKINQNEMAEMMNSIIRRGPMMTLDNLKKSGDTI